MFIIFPNFIMTMRSFGKTSIPNIAYNFAYFYGTYSKVPAGIKNNHIFLDALTNKGWLGIALGTFMIAFYIDLYFYPEYLTNWVLLVDPVSYKLNGGPASHWFLYGFMYTTAVFVMGIRMILKYRHNVYQIIRTVSVIFFQTAIAFILPEILVALHKPGYDFKNIWPIDYDFFYSYNLTAHSPASTLPWGKQPSKCRIQHRKTGQYSDPAARTIVHQCPFHNRWSSCHKRCTGRRS